MERVPINYYINHVLQLAANIRSIRLLSLSREREREREKQTYIYGRARPSCDGVPGATQQRQGAPSMHPFQRARTTRESPTLPCPALQGCICMPTMPARRTENPAWRTSARTLRLRTYELDPSFHGSCFALHCIAPIDPVVCARQKHTDAYHDDYTCDGTDS